MSPNPTPRVAVKPEVMTVREVAVVLGYSEEHVRRLCRRGDLPGRKPAHNRLADWKFYAHEIQAEMVKRGL